ncbi:hypothetical protein DID88_004044 [Monilinia fructigena]|uniref:F-box domain-containing protein n=1 Tax=Monilinia fructigena TaxID=38457 RepID=A0A395IRK4_9HELO|nr:hypothetical protein DID88_004044 [Monilinia fructigena]
MENNEKYLHGRLDPGIESTLQLVEGVDSPESTSFLPSLEAPSPESSHGENTVFTGISSSNEATFNLNHLPIELLRHISSYLRPCDLIKLGKTCKVLSEVAKTDSLWRHLVQKNVPGIKLDAPSPCASFKELYKAHDPHWFLPKNKLWFADVPSFGQLMIAKYDPKTGSIFLHRLVAEKQPPQFHVWGDDIKVIVHCFEPRWMDMNGQVRMGDEVQTWSTIDPKFYTPTEYSPYRGIFIGDYSGSLRAVKLTGDPNVPRGELTWFADDIGERGFVRFGEKNWPGARIVKSVGQIANVGYENPKYIETQLIMISHDTLAQHWEPFGHISFFRRVNIDDFLNPGKWEFNNLGMIWRKEVSIL